MLLNDGHEIVAEQGLSGVTMVTYEPQRIELHVNLGAPGYLVLTDTHYPGWIAEVDGQPAAIQRADLYFRAIPMQPGAHRVTLQFQPTSIRLGLAISAVGWLIWALALAIIVTRIGRKSATGV